MMKRTLVYIKRPQIAVWDLTKAVPCDSYLPGNITIQFLPPLSAFLTSTSRNLPCFYFSTQGTYNVGFPGRYFVIFHFQTTRTPGSAPVSAPTTSIWRLRRHPYRCCLSITQVPDRNAPYRPYRRSPGSPAVTPHLRRRVPTQARPPLRSGVRERSPLSMERHGGGLCSRIRWIRLIIKVRIRAYRNQNQNPSLLIVFVSSVSVITRGVPGHLANWSPVQLSRFITIKTARAQLQLSTFNININRLTTPNPHLNPTHQPNRSRSNPPSKSKKNGRPLNLPPANPLLRPCRSRAHQALYPRDPRADQLHARWARFYPSHGRGAERNRVGPGGDWESDNGKAQDQVLVQVWKSSKDWSVQG